MANTRNTSCGKMSQGHSPPEVARTSAVSSKKSAKLRMSPLLFLNLRSGTMQEKSWQVIILSPTDCSMRNTGEFPREENASTLSQILQVNVPEKYSLSPRACQGILRRASVRGKELPEVLRIALEKQAAKSV